MAVYILKETLWLSLLLSAPILVAGLVIGLAVGVFQSVTQIHEMTLTFIPKILAVVAVILVLFPWMIQSMLAFTRNIFQLMGGV
ncbi:MAG: flagellar biosynthesis protein FliQ [Calditrichaeota bacterium]|nr:flagellar biosynthesis protein FliQ [Candidatus Cloacimonadota bacterium]MCA9786229.1 flagellar biosynthesis protein FliQ [Candidatus Cloacimonadota bacterium]MCB1045913.1 flagellar biosynthesis protein FliQ [Calditrichota bacterium]MCB9474717.1 flagellar biosynthesis protein FliQ [Candidatus Delongbacteria bacterium]